MRIKNGIGQELYVSIDKFSNKYDEFPFNITKKMDINYIYLEFLKYCYKK